MAATSSRARKGLSFKRGAAVVTRQGGQKIAAINMYRRNQNGGGRALQNPSCLHTHTHTHTHTSLSWRKVRPLHLGNTKPDNP
jgi:hypothetical protein